MFNNLAFILATSNALSDASNYMTLNKWDENYAVDYLKAKMRSIKLYYSNPSNFTEVQRGQVLSFLLCKFPSPTVSNNPVFWFNLEQYLFRIITACSFSYSSNFNGVVNYKINDKQVIAEVSFNLHHIRALSMLRYGYSITENNFSSIIITDNLKRSNLYTDLICHCDSFSHFYTCHHIDLIKFYTEYRSIFHELST